MMRLFSALSIVVFARRRLAAAIAIAALNKSSFQHRRARRVAEMMVKCDS